MASQPAIAHFRAPSSRTSPIEKGADRSAPFCFFRQVCRAPYWAGALADLVNSENCSLPTKPNFVTFEALMMFSTCAERLSARKSEIIELSRRFEGLWWCGHFQDSFDGGPTLSAHILGVVASFGCSLFIDNYFSSEDDSPEALSPPT